MFELRSNRNEYHVILNFLNFLILSIERENEIFQEMEFTLEQTTIWGNDLDDFYMSNALSIYQHPQLKSYFKFETYYFRKKFLNKQLLLLPSKQSLDKSRNHWKWYDG
jgi:hypothetical protein